MSDPHHAAKAARRARRRFAAWLRDDLPALAIPALAAARLDRLALAILLASIRGPRLHPDQPAILCLDRQNFSRDIAELRKRTRLDWLALRQRLCARAQHPYTPERAKQQMFYFCQQGPDIDRARARATRLFRRFVRAIRRRGVGAILSANNDYWQDEAIRAACAAERMPFLVLSREHYARQAQAETRMRRYREARFRFTGTAVAVFGPQTRDTMLATGACSPDQVRVTGAPRLDEWRDPPPHPPGSPCLTLISFARPQYGAPRCARETLLAFERLSAISPLPCVVKCKNEEDRGLVASALADAGQPAPPHLQILLGTPMRELLLRSRAVVGFNSLALLEALLSPAAICVPNWGDAAANPENQMLPPSDPLAREAVHFADSPEALDRWLRGAATAAPSEPPDPRPRLALLRRFFHFPDHRSACDEVADFVLEQIRSAT